jgi:hypothetical protein
MDSDFGLANALSESVSASINKPARTNIRVIGGSPSRIGHWPRLAARLTMHIDDGALLKEAARLPVDQTQLAARLLRFNDPARPFITNFS